MSEVRRIPLSPSIAGDSWLEFQDQQTFEFLSHLQSDNEALEHLRHALEEDGLDAVIDLDPSRMCGGLCA